MPIDISTRFVFSLDRPTDVLLQFEAAAIPEQAVSVFESALPSAEHVARIPAEDAIGERVWLRGEISAMSASRCFRALIEP